MDGVPIELINYKLAEKVEQKKRKLIKEHKIAGNEEDNKPEENYFDLKEQKEKDIINLLKKSSIEGGSGFYHNPDSINLTLKQNQMKSMYINRPNNNIYGNNNNQNENKIENKKKEEKNKKIKDNEIKKDNDENPKMSLEQFNQELD